MTAWAGAPDLDLRELAYWVVAVNNGTLAADGETIVAISNDVGSYYQVFVILCLAAFAACIYFFSSSGRFSTTQSMATLKDTEQENAPSVPNSISVVVALLPWRLKERAWNT